jgi:rubrerythrin
VSSVSGQIADDHRGNDESSRSIVQVQAAVQDIRAGISDAELMQKYRLSAKGLQALFDHLITVSAINPSELRMRDPLGEETVDVVQVIHKLDQHHDGVAQESAEMPRTCIACGAPQTAEYEKCPVCGENTQEYRARKAREERMAHAIWTCPACGRPQLQEFDECPVCGVIVAKYKKLPPESKSTSA